MNAGPNYKNPLFTPYPDWKSNDDTASCANLQSVQSMEVDTRGTMWVIDGVRINNYTRCPAKLVLLDLNNGGKLVHKYVFPETLVRRNGGFLNDIVVDETDGKGIYDSKNNLIISIFINTIFTLFILVLFLVHIKLLYKSCLI